MMTFLLFLIAFAITYNNVTARPMTDSDVKAITSNGLDEYLGDGMILKLPTFIKQGMSIHINGILNINDKMLTVILRDYDENEDCKIMLDFENETINVTPAIEGYESAPYDLGLGPGEQSKFTLSLIARAEEMLAVHIQISDLGESPQLICDIKKFKNINSIEMRKGVARIDSLLFEFKENN